jgi:hypothetical protein
MLLKVGEASRLTNAVLGSIRTTEPTALSPDSTSVNSGQHIPNFKPN